MVTSKKSFFFENFTPTRSLYREMDLASIPHVRFLSLLSFLLIQGCFLLPDADRYLVETPGFQSPELCFRSFTAAIRYKRSDLEYKCFSEEFKEKNEITLQRYALVRARLEQEYPNLKWIGRMGIKESQRNDDHNAFVLASLFGKELLIRMIRQDYAFLTFKDGRTLDFFLPSSVAQAIRSDDSRWEIVIDSPLLRGLERKQIESFQLLPEWKILSFEQPAKP